MPTRLLIRAVPPMCPDEVSIVGEFVRDFSATKVDTTNYTGAFNFESHLKLLSLFFQLHPTGYKAFWDVPVLRAVNPAYYDEKRTI